MTPLASTSRLVCALAAAFAAADTGSVESQAEIQINLCSDPAQVISTLALVGDRKPTTVWLFDSPTLDLNRAGLRLRLREHRKGSELTLKVAGQNCEQVNPALLKPNGKCEADLHGDALDDVISLSRRLEKSDRERLLASDTARGAPLAAALTAAMEPSQRTMLAEHRSVTGGAEPLPSDISRLGPSSERFARRRGLDTSGRAGIRRAFREDAAQRGARAALRTHTARERGRPRDMSRSGVAGEEQAHAARALTTLTGRQGLN